MLTIESYLITTISYYIETNDLYYFPFLYVSILLKDHFTIAVISENNANPSINLVFMEPFLARSTILNFQNLKNHYLV